MHNAEIVLEARYDLFKRLFVYRISSAKRIKVKFANAFSKKPSESPAANTLSDLPKYKFSFFVGQVNVAFRFL